MIVRVPKSKFFTKSLNESFDTDDVFGDLDGSEDVEAEAIDSYVESIVKPKVTKVLSFLRVDDYELFTDNNLKVGVNVNNNLYLPNKDLEHIPFNLFYFNNVLGDCNYAGNSLTNWTKFPKYIAGNCYANFNKIKNFNGAPIVKGHVIASLQKTKTVYPLTQDNYDLFRSGQLTENSVYAIPVNRFGSIYSIAESDNSCIIQFDDMSRQKFKLNEVEYIGSVEKLFK